MANPEHVKILKQGVKTWNQWRDDNPDITPDLSGADLTGAHLRDINFSMSNLSRIKLREANLRGAALNDADLSRADISRANLFMASLSRANLTQARLERSSLLEACLSEANLENADFAGSNLSFTKLKGANTVGANFRGTILENKNNDNSTNKETSKASKITIKQKIRVAVENPETYSELRFRSNDLVVLVKALTEYYHNHDNEITPEEREIKDLLITFGKKLEAFNSALESYPTNKNIDEVEAKAFEFKHELEVLDKTQKHELEVIDRKAFNGMIGKWNTLFVYTAGIAILERIGVPVTTVAEIALNMIKK